MRIRNKAFTLIELLAVVAIVILLGSLAFGGCAGCMGGGSGQGNVLVNPIHESTVTFKVIKSYAMAGEIENVYRVFGQIIQDSDGGSGEETFEVRDSWLDGNMVSADIFGKLQDDHTYQATCRGERSGVRSSFRGITSLLHVTGPE